MYRTHLIGFITNFFYSTAIINHPTFPSAYLRCPFQVFTYFDAGTVCLAIINGIVQFSIMLRQITRFSLFYPYSFNKWVHKSSVSLHYIHFVNHSFK